MWDMTTQQQNFSVRLGPDAQRQLADLLSYYNEGSIAAVTASDVVRGALNMAHIRLIEGGRDTEPTT